VATSRPVIFQLFGFARPNRFHLGLSQRPVNGY
jgi:hypothetical protein